MLQVKGVTSLLFAVAYVRGDLGNSLAADDFHQTDQASTAGTQA
jgi:hypothetical protein